MSEHTLSAEKARRAAIKTTIVAAILPTLLSAQGMICVAHDLLALNWVAAGALAAFLEIALISMALMARAATLRGQHARVDIAATWLLSALSGVFSALHEIAGNDGWSQQPRDLVAAAVRLVAPLVAAWLWHRLLSDDTRSAAPRTREQEQLHRAGLRVALTALQVRRGQDNGQNTDALQRKLDRQHHRLLRDHSTDQLADLLSAVGGVETLPDQTRPKSMGPIPPIGPQVAVTDSDPVQDRTDRLGPDPLIEVAVQVEAIPADSGSGPVQVPQTGLAQVRSIKAPRADIGALVEEVKAAIATGQLPQRPSTEVIRRHIGKAKATANAVAAALKAERDNTQRTASA